MEGEEEASERRLHDTQRGGVGRLSHEQVSMRRFIGFGSVLSKRERQAVGSVQAGRR